MSTSSAVLRVQALGSLQVHRGPVAVDLGPAKQRAVFAALALHVGDTVSTDTLLEMVWGTDQPVSARQLVHTYVARLRRLLEPEIPPRGRTNVISSGTGGYRLVTSDSLSDVTSFKLLYRRAGHYLRAGEPGRAFDLLGEALRLWRDPDLRELSALLHNGEAIDPLRRLWCDAALTFVDIGLGLGQAPQVLAVARRLAAAEPLNEIVHARYLLALLQTGRRAAAIEHYHNVRVLLHAELGVPPGPQLVEAFRLVQRGQPASAPARPAPAVTAEPQRPPWHGPGPGLQQLAGREHDLDVVRELLSQHRMLTVAGPPGCGKSALALQVAAGLRDDFLGGVLVLECSVTADPARLGHRLTALLTGEPGGCSPAPLLGDQHMLVVLDNAEHLIDAAGALADEVVRACRHVSVVVTSREPLGLPYETVWRLQPLGVAAAVQLFTRRADQVSPGLAPTPAEEAIVADLCDRLDRLPLAIELAAECLATETLDELVRRLDDPVRELCPPRRGQPVHHRSLRAALLRSLGCLDAEERWCFARLGGLPRRFTAADAQQVWDRGPEAPVNTRAMLMRLADKSLVSVRHARAGPRYAMLRLVRRFAADLPGADPAGIH